MKKTKPQPSLGNVCIRCGKPRVFKDSWQEKLTTGQGQSVVTHSQFVCPDDECQKLVELSLAEKHQIARDRQAAQDERLQRHAASRAHASSAE